MSDPHANPPGNPAPPLRRAARVLVIDRHDRVLLFRFVDPVSGAAFWITPGGGLNDGETFEDAARRELREETGLDTAALSPCVWTRTVDIRYGHKAFRQHECFFVTRVDRPDIRTDGLLDYEATDLVEHRWWSAEAISRCGERFAPSRLGSLLDDLITKGQNTDPIDVGR